MHPTRSAMSSRVGHDEHSHVGLTNADLPGSDVTGTQEACSLEEKLLEWLCGWRVRRMLGRGGGCRFRGPQYSTQQGALEWAEVWEFSGLQFPFMKQTLPAPGILWSAVTAMLPAVHSEVTIVQMFSDDGEYNYISWEDKPTTLE